MYYLKLFMVVILFCEQEISCGFHLKVLTETNRVFQFIWVKILLPRIILVVFCHFGCLGHFFCLWSFIGYIHLGYLSNLRILVTKYIFLLKATLGCIYLYGIFQYFFLILFTRKCKNFMFCLLPSDRFSVNFCVCFHDCISLYPW